MKIQEFKKSILDKQPNLEREVKKDLAFQVGQMLIEARIMKGMTQKALADMIGTKQPSIAKIENGSMMPSLKLLKRVADKWNTYLIPPRFAFMEHRSTSVEYRSGDNSKTEQGYYWMRVRVKKPTKDMLIDWESKFTEETILN